MAGKVQRKDRKYNHLSMKQKTRIADKTYLAYLRFYLENGRMPDETESGNICRKLFQSVLALAPQADFGAFEKLCESRTLKYEARILLDMDKGVTLETLEEKKRKKTPEERAMIQKKKSALKRRNRTNCEKERMIQNMDQDDTFFYIAGHTSGGAPYGVTWEEMGLNLWEEVE